LPNAKHLLPLERAADVARLIDEHIMSIDSASAVASATDTAYLRLIDSNRVSHGTRDVLNERGRPDDPAYEPVVLDHDAFITLQAILARAIPQPHEPPIDLAARIDAQLQAGTGDGWRFADLPPDADAYRAALFSVQDETQRRFARAFTDLNDAERDDVLTQIAAGRIGSEAAETTPPGRLRRSQLRAWFEDVRADAVRLYMAHPATLARIGFSGIANGGDGEPKSGFARVGVGEREAWEPVAVQDGRS
jgi:hypothetical protein